MMEVGASFNVDVDVLGIAEAIAGAVSADQNRDAFVKNLMETAFYKADQRYNVMVCNLNNDYEAHFNGVQMYASADYNGIIFGIWVFEDGEFINRGDGGWINWAFQGWFERSGDQGHYVTFHKP